MFYSRIPFLLDERKLAAVKATKTKTVGAQEAFVDAWERYVYHGKICHEPWGLYTVTVRDTMRMQPYIICIYLYTYISIYIYMYI